MTLLEKENQELEEELSKSHFATQKQLEFRSNVTKHKSTVEEKGEESQIDIFSEMQSKHQI